MGLPWLSTQSVSASPRVPETGPQHRPKRQTPRIMRAQHRFLLLTAAAVLLLAIVVADEPLSSPSPTSPAGSQTTEPMANSEPIISGKSEASGESEIGTPADPMTTEVAPVSFAGADRAHTDEVNGDMMLNSDASNLGSFSLDPLPGDTQSGPAMDVPAHSHESQESLDHEVDSEETLASQEACEERCCLLLLPPLLKALRCPSGQPSPACSCAAD
uniref:uncharacterized protein LOC114600133 isoform X1 n=1 Tax=Podarcis muralis TaxID=64176 RepID=UPI00109F3A16|nr:uncharacterized protein LOC114600133 isoform X1 [Podarcis muralis]